MKRSEIRRILKRNRGSKAELARRAGVGLTAVSAWLRGGTSANITEKAQVLCRELLDKEEVDRIARGEANGPSARKIIDQLRKKPSQEES
ncbi:MAG: helix-turn-helix transcriptional regulator [Patescibacteria group bacterium]|nr:helix-turn-helix transcriptional regulator [Patescibacteria group bacterium]